MWCDSGRFRVLLSVKGGSLIWCVIFSVFHGFGGISRRLGFRCQCLIEERNIPQLILCFYLSVLTMFSSCL